MSLCMCWWRRLKRKNKPQVRSLSEMLYISAHVWKILCCWQPVSKVVPKLFKYGRITSQCANSLDLWNQKTTLLVLDNHNTLKSCWLAPSTALLANLKQQQQQQLWFIIVQMIVFMGRGHSWQVQNVMIDWQTVDVAYFFHTACQIRTIFNSPHTKNDRVPKEDTQETCLPQLHVLMIEFAFYVDICTFDHEK